MSINVTVGSRTTESIQGPAKTQFPMLLFSNSKTLKACKEAYGEIRKAFIRDAKHRLAHSLAQTASGSVISKTLQYFLLCSGTICFLLLNQT